MKEGWWLNYRTGRSFPVHDHEMWLRRPGNGKRLGLPETILTTALRRYRPGEDRDRLLTFVIMCFPAARIRGHGAYVTIEHRGWAVSDLIPAIRRFGRKQGFGPMLGLNIRLINTGEGHFGLWRDFPQFLSESCLARAMKGWNGDAVINLK